MAQKHNRHAKRRTPAQQQAVEVKRCRYEVNKATSLTRAFVASPNSGIGSHRSVVLVSENVNSHYHPGKAWRQAIKCWNGDHLLRAQVYASAIDKAAQDALHRLPDSQLENDR